MRVGETVGDFELLDQHGETVRFADLIEKGPVVLYFYIKAKTAG